MSTETGPDKAGAAWHLDLRRAAAQFELVVTDAATGNTLARQSLRPEWSRSALDILEELIGHLGSPREIRTDHGMEFAANAFRELLQSLSIQHRVVPPSASPAR